MIKKKDVKHKMKDNTNVTYPTKYFLEFIYNIPFQKVSFSK